jgi:hypothetical protein
MKCVVSNIHQPLYPHLKKGWVSTISATYGTEEKTSYSGIKSCIIQPTNLTSQFTYWLILANFRLSLSVLIND